MSKMIEYINPHSRIVQLSSPDKKIIKIPARSKVILSEHYLMYCPKHLRVVRVVNDSKALAPKKIDKSAMKYTPTNKKANRLKVGNKRTPKLTRPKPKPIPTIDKPKKMKPQIPAKISGKRVLNKPVVGKRSREDYSKLYKRAYENNGWSISNNIGIGILSYNRLPSLQRLIGSIRQYTNLNRTTVFVSDESDDPKVMHWLKAQKDIVTLTNQNRLGIAGNSNRLLKCLSRFKYCLLLNDDVEVLQTGWESFYCVAAKATRYHHFCYQQIGVYGAKKPTNGNRIGGTRISTIADKPHGAVMFYTNELFNKIGYFDEKFGYYGMEHVDWSSRAAQSGMQPIGYHDVIGSDKYFRIHQEKSAVLNRTAELNKARTVQNSLGTNRSYVEATEASDVPSTTVVIPIRDIGRTGALEVVVNSIRAQLYPRIEIIISEQDDISKLRINELLPCKQLLAKSKYKSQPFTKAMAFNIGFANANNNNVILQDADIICPQHYVNKVCKLLEEYDGIHIGSRVLYMNNISTSTIVKTKVIDVNKQCERVVTYFEGGSLACTKKAYFACGGFNEVFEGYGIEDCDFFERLKYNSNFYDTRSEDFVHMWHGRTSGWQQYHKKNKKIFLQLKKQYNMTDYIKSLVVKLNKIYPTILKKLGIEE